MLGAPSSAIVAGAHAVVVAGLLIAFGYLLVDALTGARLHPVNKLALAFPALAGWALVLMGAHMISGGRVFSQPLAVRLSTLLAFVAVGGFKLYRRARSSEERQPKTYLWLVAAALAVAWLVMVWPAFRLLPLPPTPDAQLHAGWTMQLLSGDSTPGATITGDVPNYYPWMFHALAAFVSDVVPGHHAWFAFGPIQVLQVTGVVTALFAAGRELTARATGGLGAAVFGAMSGGVGFVMLRMVDVANKGRVSGSEGAMEYIGDLVVTRPYNATFLNLPPPLPRDVALTLLAALVLTLTAACTRKSISWFVVAGVITGMIGLTGGESFVIALIAVVLVPIAGVGIPRSRALGAVLLPTVAIYAIWFLPIVVNYLDLGGFVNTTHLGPIELPPLGFLGAWGIAIPFGIWGLIRAVPQVKVDVRVRVLLSVVLATVAALVASTFIPSAFGEGFATLGTGHRYWPYVYLGLALLAAYGFSDVVRRLIARSTRGAAFFVALVVATGLASPLIASVAMVRAEQRGPVYQLLNHSLVGDEETVLTALLQGEPGDCVVAVPPELSRLVFSYTGYRQVLWQGGATGPNRARIRWEDIYERIPGDRVREQDNRSLVEGVGPSDRWGMIVKKYGVDFVVVAAKDAGEDVFRGYASTPVGPRESGYAVFDVGDC